MVVSSASKSGDCLILTVASRFRTWIFIGARAPLFCHAVSKSRATALVQNTQSVISAECGFDKSAFESGDLRTLLIPIYSTSYLTDGFGKYIILTQLTGIVRAQIISSSLEKQKPFSGFTYIGAGGKFGWK